MESVAKLHCMKNCDTQSDESAKKNGEKKMWEIPALRFTK